MQHASVLSNHALTGIVQHWRLSMNMHVWFSFEKCDVRSVSKMPIIITIYEA